MYHGEFENTELGRKHSSQRVLHGVPGVMVFPLSDISWLGEKLLACYSASGMVRGCGTAQFDQTRTVTHNNS